MDEEYYLNRDIDKKLEDELNFFIEEYLKLGFEHNTSMKFYKFILNCYEAPREHRYSVSELASKKHKSRDVYTNILFIPIYTCT